MMNKAYLADQQKILLAWLKKETSIFQGALLWQSAFSLCALLLQIALFACVAFACQILLIEKQSLSPELLGISFAIVLILFVIERFASTHAQQLQRRIFHHFQQQLWQQFTRGQYALIRQHSGYFWQQIYLAHLPTIAQYSVHYRVQQNIAMLMPLIVIALIFPLNPLIAFSLLFSIPIIPLFMILIGKGAANRHRLHFKALARMGSIFVDRIKSLELLHIFQSHEEQNHILSSASEELNKRTMNVVGVAFLSSSVLDFFSTLAVALVAVFVGFNLLGEFSLGGVLDLKSGLFILLISPLCFAQLKQLGQLYHLRAQAIASADEIKAIFEQYKPANHSLDARHFQTIDWHNFSIATPAIQAAHIQLKKGDWINLQGASGSGKTCFLEGLMGQRNSSHQIENAALVGQHPIILPTNIRHNLSLGKNISDEKLLKIIEQVELDTWLAQQTDGLDSALHEEIALSGGQKQRLALARILLSEAPIILLDEPTAHLTEAQHQRLSQMIYQQFQHKTLIWASHKALPKEWFSQQWHIEKGCLKT